MTRRAASKYRPGKIIKKAAEAIGCSTRTIYNLIDRDGIEALVLRLQAVNRPDLAAAFEAESAASK